MSSNRNGNRNFGGKPFKPVPDRWEDYTNAGDRISGSRFVCMKVPLKEELCQLVDEKLRFTPTQMVSVLKERGMTLGLLIDLTNTQRYYRPKEIIGTGAAYEKIYVEGHEVPGSKHVERFFSVVDQFEKAREDGEKEDSVVIGVHCTHGINRTGYLVCRYLIDRLGWTAENAIAEFSRARGHPIERPNYLEALQNPSPPGMQNNTPSSSSMLKSGEGHSSFSSARDQSWNRYDRSPIRSERGWYHRDQTRRDDDDYWHRGRYDNRNDWYDNRGYDDRGRYSNSRTYSYGYNRRWDREFADERAENQRYNGQWWTNERSQNGSDHSHSYERNRDMHGYYRNSSSYRNFESLSK